MSPTKAVLAALFALVIPAPGHAQVPQGARTRVLPEVRAELVMGETSSAHLGGGVHISTGAYVRLAILTGVGQSWQDSENGTSYRLEVQGRFVLDPLRQSRYGLYGIGGINAAHDPFTDWQTRMVLGIGAELPAHGRGALAIEAALAGGFRISIATRRLPLGRR